jgi:homoserine O-acetyltransferase/O-succinyltransferase
MTKVATAALAALLLSAGSAEAQIDPLNVQRGTFAAASFRLENGSVMSDVKIAYETYGRLAADGRNAILMSPGFTTSHRFVGNEESDQEASWGAMIGPAKAIDTDRYFVVSVAHLGSSFGSTHPADINPATGKPYGPDFPDVRAADMVNAQKAVLESLGVKHLVAVVAQSYGGRHAFQWGVTYPNFMNGVVAVETSPKDPRGPAGVESLVGQLAKDPNWNGGWYYDKGGISTILTEMRVATLKAYGIDEKLAGRFPDKAQREAEIVRLSRGWATSMDGNSLVVLRRANVGFDAEKDFDRIKAKVLYVLSRTDKSFPPSIAPEVMSKLRAASVKADYFEIDSEFGHGSAFVDAQKWAPRLQSFLSELQTAK